MIAISNRMNSQLIFFDNRTLKLLGTVPTSVRMFHMWPSTEQNEIFAVADIGRVVDVIKIKRFGNRIICRHRMIDIGTEAEISKT